MVILGRGRVGGWLPKVHYKVGTWRVELLTCLKSGSHPLDPSLQPFQTFIETNLTIYRLFQLMLEKIPPTFPFSQRSNGQTTNPRLLKLLQVFNILKRRARYWVYNDKGQEGLVDSPSMHIIMQFQSAAPLLWLF